MSRSVSHPLSVLLFAFALLLTGSTILQAFVPSMAPHSPSSATPPAAKRAKTNGDGNLGRKIAMEAAQKPTEKTEPPAAKVSLKILSFNMAGCQPSKVAPSSWTQSDALEAMEQEILKVEDRHPDIIALQEAPSFIFDRNRAFADYKLIGYQSSHAPYVALYVHQKWNATRVLQEAMNNFDFEGLPAVVAEIDLCTSETGTQQHSDKHSPRRLWIASLHLEPFAGGASIRKRQLKALTTKAKAANVPLILAGDTNMRVSEDSVADDDLGLLDLWKLAGSDIRTKYTWNTRDDLDKGGYFNQFYGSQTREYIARYDRMYAINPAPPKVHRQDAQWLQVKSFQLVANRPVGKSSRHFLSDHFGITAEVTILRTT